MLSGQRPSQVGAVVAGGLLLAACGTTSEDQVYRDAVRLCQARAAAAIAGVETYKYRDIVYSPAPDHFIAMIADRGAPPDHVLTCDLRLADGKVTIVKSAWDQKVFGPSDRLSVNAGLEARGLSTAEGAR